MNHDPGPRTTQSASRDRGDRLRAGRRVLRARGAPRPPGRSWRRPRPGRARWSARRGRPGRAPRTSAAMSSGVTAIGSTRPCAPSSRPTQSSAADVVAEQLPQRDDQQVADGVVVQLAVAGEAVLQHAAPRSGPSRRRRTAPRAPCRRSPGGSTPNSRRSRPDEPPLSATVTTAVRSVDDVAQRRQATPTRPCPPPSATTRRSDGVSAGAAWSPSLPPEVAVHRPGVDAARRAAARRSPRPSRRCGACRRCSRPRRS